MSEPISPAENHVQRATHVRHAYRIAYRTLKHVSAVARTRDMPPQPPAADVLASIRRCGRADLWGALGLARGATDAVTRAYRCAALAVHPDKLPEAQRDEAAAAMAVLNEAKEVLTDPVTRRML